MGMVGIYRKYLGVENTRFLINVIAVLVGRFSKPMQMRQ